MLFVCLGNICRSPTAEGVFSAVAARAAPSLLARVDSAGTAGYHIGEPPDPRTQAAAARHGYDLSALRARQVALQDFAQFDLLLAMDRANLAALQRQAPKSTLSRVQLLLPYCGVDEPSEVPDPYYGSQPDFDRVVQIIEMASTALVARLQSSRVV